MLGCSVEELLRRRDEIARSDVTSLNAVVMSEDDAEIERMETIASDDERADPEAAAHARRRQGPLPRGVRGAARA